MATNAQLYDLFDTLTQTSTPEQLPKGGTTILYSDLRSFEIRFDSKVMDQFENFRIGRACPLLIIVKRLKPLMALRGIV